jgi:hypothetical protein
MAGKAPDQGNGADLRSNSSLVLTADRPLNLELFPVLRSHVIGHRAVLPMALTVELLAHGALHDNPGLLFHGFDNLRICKGIRLSEDETCQVRVLSGKAGKQEGLWRVPVELHVTRSDGRRFLHATASIVLAGRLPAPEGTVPGVPVTGSGPSVAEIYRELLFHGPDLHGIQRIESLDGTSCSAWIAAAPRPGDWLRQPLRGAWLADPLALDSAFQLMCLWSYEQAGAFSLPSLAGCYRQYRRSFPSKGVEVRALIRECSDHRAVADLWFVDGGGEVVARLVDYECVIDPSLNQAFRQNRLAAQPVSA